MDETCWLVELKYTTLSPVWLDENKQQTKDATKAKRFESKKQANDWIIEENLTFKYWATEHMFLDDEPKVN